MRGNSGRRARSYLSARAYQARPVPRRVGGSRRHSDVTGSRIARSSDIWTLRAEGLAAVRAPHLSGAPTRGVGRQIQDQVGLILGLAQRAERRLLLHAVDERVVLR